MFEWSWSLLRWQLWLRGVLGGARWRGHDSLGTSGKLEIQCETPKIAKLVYKSNSYGLWYL